MRRPVEIGERFGRLVVKERCGRKGNNALFKFECDCGNFVIRTGVQARAKKLKSCGCLRKEVAAKMGRKYGRLYGGILINRKLAEPGLDSCWRLWRDYRHGASERGLAFELSKEQFRALTGKPCFYCGALPCCVMRGRQKKVRSDYVYNGIDRVDSKLGYTTDNTVPCCKWCNRAKWNRNQAEFIAWASQIASRFTA